MTSIIITAWKESNTIAKAITCVGDQAYSGVNDDFEIILACPDDDTLNAAMIEVKRLGIEDKFLFVRDPGKGKPNALNMAMQKARGEILIFTDGDVYFEKNSIAKLLKHFEEKRDYPFLVSGRPKSADSKDNMMGYFGHLLSDAAHHKRTIDLTDHPSGQSLAFVRKRNFFTVSGYIYACNRFRITYPENCLVDDGYISYIAHNLGGKVEYEPEAIAYVKYPTSLDDYFKQKKRSTGGFMQLWEYGIVKPETKTRSFFRELEYFWFPVNYAKNIKEIFWSMALYPIRLWLWLTIFWERKIIKKDFIKTWVRIESTK